MSMGHWQTSRIGLMQVRNTSTSVAFYRFSGIHHKAARVHTGMCTLAFLVYRSVIIHVLYDYKEHFVQLQVRLFDSKIIVCIILNVFVWLQNYKLDLFQFPDHILTNLLNPSLNRPPYDFPCLRLPHNLT